MEFQHDILNSSCWHCTAIWYPCRIVYLRRSQSDRMLGVLSNPSCSKLFKILKYFWTWMHYEVHAKHYYYVVLWRFPMLMGCYVPFWRVLANWRWLCLEVCEQKRIILELCICYLEMHSRDFPFYVSWKYLWELVQACCKLSEDTTKLCWLDMSLRKIYFLTLYSRLQSIEQMDPFCKYHKLDHHPLKPVMSLLWMNSNWVDN
jgi:hypothetical protein